MKYNLIIIGSGSVGAAAGYYATRAGLNVLMTDAHMPPHQHGSHHGDTRLIRHAYGEGEKYVPLVLRAQTLWDELSRHNEEDPIFVRSGVINLGPADSTFLANVAHSAEQWQLNVEKLDAQGIMARWPEYASRTTTSAYLKLIPVFCAANWRLKPGSNWRRKRAVRNCSTARSPQFVMTMMA